MLPSHFMVIHHAGHYLVSIFTYIGSKTNVGEIVAITTTQQNDVKFVLLNVVTNTPLSLGAIGVGILSTV